MSCGWVSSDPALLFHLHLSPLSTASNFSPYCAAIPIKEVLPYFLNSSNKWLRVIAVCLPPRHSRRGPHVNPLVGRIFLRIAQNRTPSSILGTPLATRSGTRLYLRSDFGYHENPSSRISLSNCGFSKPTTTNRTILPPFLSLRSTDTVPYSASAYLTYWFD